MATLNQAFQKELPKLLDQVATDIGMLCDVEISLSLASPDLQSLDEIFPDLAEGAVCCRSIYMRSACGVGGLLIPTDVAMQLSNAMMMIEPEDQEDEFEFEGMVAEAMEEMWNIVVGSWSGSATADYRMSSKTDERAVEFYSNSLPFPEASGVFPFFAQVSYELDDLKSTIYLFPPLKAIQGRELSEFIAPSTFVVQTAAASTGAAATTTNAPAVAKSAEDCKPVVFLDYSGALLPYLRAVTKSKNLKYLLSEGIDPDRLADKSRQPAATIIVGSAPEELAALGEFSFVEILPKD